MEVKDILRQRREELGLSMRQLADVLGVSESTVSRWESGYIAHMKRSMIARLASALQISPLVIVGVEDQKQDGETDEAVTLLQQLRDEDRALLAVARNMTPEEVKVMTEFAKKMKGI